MLWRRDVTEIALARSEHFISNTQAESLPNFHTNSKCAIRLDIGGGCHPFCDSCRNRTVRTHWPQEMESVESLSCNMQILKTWFSQLPKAQAVQLSQSPCDCESAQLLLKWVLPGYLQHTYCSHRLSLSSPAVPPAWAPGALLQLLLLPSHLLVIASP